MARISVSPVWFAVLNIDCIAIIETVFHVKQVTRLGKMKRDVHIIDPSQVSHTILSGTLSHF